MVTKYVIKDFNVDIEDDGRVFLTLIDAEGNGASTVLGVVNPNEPEESAMSGLLALAAKIRDRYLEHGTMPTDEVKKAMMN